MTAVSSDPTLLPPPPSTRSRTAPVPMPTTGRLTVIEKVYHQLPGEQPTATEHQFVRQLRSDEQPFSRKFKVPREWKPLDLGWIECAGMLTIRNEEGRHPVVIPTHEQRADIDLRVIEVAFDEGAEPALVVLPGESCRFHPARLRDVRVRCLHGMATATIHLNPV